MSGPQGPAEPGWGQPGWGQPGWGQPGWGQPVPDPTRTFPQPGPWTGGGGPPPHGPSQHGPPPYGPPPQQGYPPEVGPRRHRGPLLGGLAALLVLAVVGGILFSRSRGDAPSIAGAAVTSPSAVPRTTSRAAVPPLPSSRTPSTAPSAVPDTTPNTTTPGTAPVARADADQITALAQRMISALNAGDQSALTSLACGEFATTVAKGVSPQRPPIVYESTRDIAVSGDTGTAQVFASNNASPASPETMSVQRGADGWRVCRLGGG